MINARYGLADPDDPARAQDVTMSNVFAKLGVYDDAPPAQRPAPCPILRERVERVSGRGKLKGPTRLREDLRQAIRAYVRGEVEEGRIANRDDVRPIWRQKG